MARQKTTEVRSTALNLTDKFEIPLLSIAIQHEINRINETQRRTKDSRKKLNQNFALETYEDFSELWRRMGEKDYWRTK